MQPSPQSGERYAFPKDLPKVDALQRKKKAFFFLEVESMRPIFSPQLPLPLSEEQKVLFKALLAAYSPQKGE